MSNVKKDPRHEDAEPAQSAEPEATAEDAAQEAAPEIANDAAEETAPEAAAEPAEEESDAERAARLEGEVAELHDQLLRTLAEAENQRRRGQREREEAVRYAAAPMLRDLLAVADNLQRALESVPGEVAGEDGALKVLLEGVQMTERELQSVFERHGIVKLEPMGERLDPHRHEAMFEVPDPSQPSGTVVQVVRSGYRLHDRLLRAAQVGVARGGPSPAPPQAPKAATDEGAGDSGETQEPEPEAQSTPGSRIDTTA